MARQEAPNEEEGDADQLAILHFFGGYARHVQSAHCRRWYAFMK